MASTFTRQVTLAVLALLAFGAPGCTSSTPHWDKQFGAASRANLAAQTIDPGASGNRNPTLGLDGPAARAAIDNYQRSFARPDTGQPAPMVGTR